MGIHIVRYASKDFLSAINGSDVWTEFEVIVGMYIIMEVRHVCLMAQQRPRKYLSGSKWKKVRKRVIILDVDVFSLVLHSRSRALKSMH